MWDVILGEVRELAITVLVALLSLGAAYALSYIRRAKEALDQRIDSVARLTCSRISATSISAGVHVRPGSPIAQGA